ncbi:MAG: phosphotransferase, partial [Chloroflexota bacterium]
QLLVYEIINDPSVFDLAWAIETASSDLLPQLTHAQNQADDLLLQLYLNSLEGQSAQDADRAPIHQLFYHRLTGGRLARFYDGTQIALPDGVESMNTMRSARWIINGQEYNSSLDDLIAAAITRLQPAQPVASIIGHGDAHNGNVFFRGENTPLMYFDPAFAGRHSPLLDLTKPLFHNVFAMWMYFPQVKAAQTRIILKREGQVWRIEHDYALHPIRQMFLRSKIERTLIPILTELKRRGELRDDWRAYLKASLFCCPFLTMNLTDPAKFPPEISLLGLTMAVEMGAESAGQRSLIDQTLDDVERALA